MKIVFCISLIFIVLMNSCQRNSDDINITGYYSIDQHVLKDSTKINSKFDYIKILNDSSVELFNCNSEIRVLGKWSVGTLSSSDKTTLIAFKFGSNNLVGGFKNSILSFQYPDDFNNGYYQISLYGKLINAPVCH
jgi:hypothetical protein